MSVPNRYLFHHDVDGFFLACVDSGGGGGVLTIHFLPVLVVVFLSGDQLAPSNSSF